MTDEFEPPVQPIARDRWGRPLVTPPGGGKAVGYTRATTYAKALEETSLLQKWQQRQVALGLSQRPALVTAVASMRGEAGTKEGKGKLDQLCSEAFVAAGGHDRATQGTALHKIAETYDQGDDVGIIPADARRDLDAYIEATAHFTWVALEQFRVNDDLQIGGTTDRVADFGSEYVIADLKTGASIDFGIGAIAMQLAIYANSIPYDHATKQRVPDEKPINRERALIIHLPAGEARCVLHWVNIADGWDAVRLATGVRSWRTRKDLAWPYEAPAEEREPSPLEQVATFTDLTEMRRWYVQLERDGHGTPDVLAACTARAKVLKAAR